LDAHVTADATEQWIRLALRDDVAFDLAAIAAKVPDCGYKLRRIEVIAEGRMQADGFVFASNGQRVALAHPSSVTAAGHVRGSFEAPIGGHPELTVELFQAAALR
jgi:hypothetical protein